MSPKRDLQAIFTKRSFLLSTGAFGALSAVGARIAYLQTLDPTNYSEAADENRFDTRIVAPPRGRIYDRFGVRLAVTSRDFQLKIVPEDATDLEATLRAVAAICELDEDWVARRVRDVRNARRFDPLLLRQGLTREQFAAVSVRLPELHGLIADAGDVRRYPYGEAFAHPIGYVQKPTERDITRAQSPEAEREDLPAYLRNAVYLRNPDVRLGKAGVEATWEQTLHGDAGWRKVEVNASGRVVSEVGHESRAPNRGSGLVLTLDAELQRLAFERMAGESAAAVVMDVVTGDLLAMASAPGFDPNQFVNGISSSAFRALNEDDHKPLFHKAVTGAYAPGSTFKMIVGIAAREAGVEDDWRVNCPGYFPFGGRNFHCWRRGGHGSVDLHNAIKGSCDVYFYQAALRAGPERIARVARQFGFGVKHDIGVPSIEDGIVPDPDWWRGQGRGVWTPGLTVNFGIGQGDLLASPLQLAVMAARLANNGRAVAPRLVRETAGLQPPGEAPMIQGVRAEHLAAVREGMYGVCNEGGGTATRAGDLQLAHTPDGRIVEVGPDTRGMEPVRIAGKTGTAQVRAITSATRGVHYSRIEWRFRDHGLFVCFGPWRAPRYACAVIVEHGGGGSAVAGPIARDIMRATLLRGPSAQQAANLAALESDDDIRLTSL
ncbi:MAG: penicillin-binding protein 2 [Alphaproteobacteria bacterium]|nr:penicillin-binding protein 2 [Alphaproteobacteria bacterium]